MSVRKKNGMSENNERLEFLGDAILDAIVGDVVYRHFDNKREGFLTNARSKIVQRETLGKLAVEMGLDKLIRSNQSHNNSHNSYMAGNAFEALVGAIYLDYGYTRCMKFMEKRILNHIIDIDKVAYKEVNFKSKLLEWSQKNRIHLEFKDLPQSADKSGANMFNTMVVIEDLDCGRGNGYSKKESQQNAAKETLFMLKKQKGFEESVFEAKSRRTAMEEQPEALLPEIPDDLLLAKPEEQAKKKTAKAVSTAKKNEATTDEKEEKSPVSKKEEKQKTTRNEDKTDTEQRVEKPATETAKAETSTKEKSEKENRTDKKKVQNAPKNTENAKENDMPEEISFDSVEISLKKSKLDIPEAKVEENEDSRTTNNAAGKDTPKPKRKPRKKQETSQKEESEKKVRETNNEEVKEQVQNEEPEQAPTPAKAKRRGSRHKATSLGAVTPKTGK